MAQVISTLTNAISLLNTLYEADDTPPTAGEEDFTVWTALFNLGINLWENEEGMLWRELFVKSSVAVDGDMAITTGNFSYDVPTNFRFPASGYVWLGNSPNATPIRIFRPEEIQLFDNHTGNYAYFLNNTTLEFNPNSHLTVGDTITYTYYKKASAVSSGSDTFEMSDPAFCVYYALAELKKEEGDPTASAIASQKMEGMKVKNMLPSHFQQNRLENFIEGGFGN